MTYSYSYNKQIDPDVLLGIITIDLGIAPLYIDYDLITFDFSIIFENELTGQQETDLTSIIDTYIYVDVGNYATFNSVYTSEFSATTINSGSTNLYNIFSVLSNSGETNTVSNIGSGVGLFKQKNGVDFQFRTLSAGTNITFTKGDTITLNVTNDGNDITRVQSGINTTTGGTANNPTVNLVASPSVNNIIYSGTSTGGNSIATNVSATTFYSASTNLDTIIRNLVATDITRVQSGTNITTGGTANNPTVNLVASPSINNLSFSGIATGGNSIATNVSATTAFYSAGTNLYNIFLTAAQLSGTSVSAGSNIGVVLTGSDYKVSVVGSPSFNNITFSGTSTGGNSIATNVSATTAFYSAGTNLDTIIRNVASGTNDITRIQPGTNITTGGTGNNPTVNLVASPSVNNISFSGTAIGGTVQAGAGTFTSLSATTLSGGTIYSGGTNLYNIFLTAAQLSGTSVSAGSNIGVVLTGSDYKVSVVGSPSFNNITFSGTAIGGTVQAGAGTFTSTSATTLSGGTIYSGGTNLNVYFGNVFSQLNTKSNLSGATFTGGVIAPSLSATTLSGGTIYSGGTNLYNIFATIGSSGSGSYNQPGSNITTAGTSSNQIISVVGSPSFNNITFSGTAIGGTVQAGAGTFTSTSATTLSGGTIYSGGTNLYNIFAQPGRVVNGVQPGTNITTGGTATNPTINLVDSPSINNLSFSGEAIGNALSASSISGYTIFLKDMDSGPSTPTTGATIFVKDKANRKMAAQVGPSGIDYTFQPALYGNKIALWNPPGNSTTVPGVLGISALSATGTATARNVAATNMFTRTKRIGVVSAVPAGSLAGYRNTVAQYTVGNGSGLGGFMFVIRFGVADSQTGTRMFVGMRNSTGAPSNIEPSTITNCIGVGNGAADSNLFIYYGGSAAQTPIDLGANFPCNTNSTDVYELTLFSPPNSNNTIGYRVERLNTGDIAQGVITGTAGTQIPSSSTLLTMNTFRTNNASNGAVAIDYISIYLETDN